LIVTKTTRERITRFGGVVIIPLDCHFGGPGFILGHGWSLHPWRS